MEGYLRVAARRSERVSSRQFEPDSIRSRCHDFENVLTQMIGLGRAQRLPVHGFQCDLHVRETGIAVVENTFPTFIDPNRARNFARPRRWPEPQLKWNH